MPEYIIDYQYDKTGNLIKQQDSRNKLNLYRYDSFGRQISCTESSTDGSDPINITCQYDLNGNKISETDGNGNITYTSYDKMNLSVTITSKVKMRMVPIQIMQRKSAMIIITTLRQRQTGLAIL